jgi:GABA(A) receptor-associated protein
MTFRTVHSFETRAAESGRIRDKFPGRIPIIVERSTRADKTMPAIDKNKFLVPGDLTLGQFIYVIRKRMELSSDKALFVFVGNGLPTTGTLIRELFRTHRDDDGFLYMEYCGESTFGSTAYLKSNIALSHPD